jgi:hypothetical protein
MTKVTAQWQSRKAGLAEARAILDGLQKAVAALEAQDRPAQVRGSIVLGRTCNHKLGVSPKRSYYCNRTRLVDSLCEGKVTGGIDAHTLEMMARPKYTAVIARLIQAHDAC